MKHDSLPVLLIVAALTIVAEKLHLDFLLSGSSPKSMDKKGRLA